ncbi:Probable Co/Zn/Cd efflux system membrane fusion protein [hydrothermal vent metagenome]|uniref:Probable Co/Zn/Cd efflux system membrane fusion protein n=1 Tax=hydrothermal vent metagenome TaxID=652676 RepID=A0A1W1D0Q2_9ZZZZ
MKKILILLPFLVSLHAVTVEQLFNVKTIEVKSKKVEISKSYNGYVKIAEDKIYTIALTQDGFIKNLTAPNIYDKVRKGKKLFDFYSPDIYKAQIELLSAKRFSPALAKNLETKLKLYDVTSQNIKMIKRKNRAFKYLPFYSPYSGIVIEKKVTEGSAVKRGMVVYKIADLSKVWVEGKAYEADRAFIQQGQKVEVTFNGAKKIYHAKIDFIYPLVDPVNKTIDFRITLSNKNGKIQPNAYATIKNIKSENIKLILPNTAVVTKGSKHFVFIPSEYEGEYKSKLIEAKRISVNEFEILSGLKEGDKVVNNSLFLLDSDVVINGED